jgi:hypothetical protein
MDDTCVTPEGTPGEKSIPASDRTCPIRYLEGFTEYKNHPQPALSDFPTLSIFTRY